MRVSVFTADGRIVRHHACRAPEKAEEWYLHWLYKIGDGTVGRVVLHQGNLKYNSARIYQDVTKRPAGNPPVRPDRGRAAFALPWGSRVEVPAGIYRPYDYVDCERVEFAHGMIVESRPGGLHAVRFDGYPNVVDYTAKEAKQFTVHAA